MLELKQYQKNALNKLKAFLEQARLIGIQQSFEKEQYAQGYATKYNAIKGLEDVPYVCLRLPTGGGKTLLSSYSISTAAISYLEQEHPLVLWLVPTDIIRKQTLEVLKNPLHPNRETLDKQFDGRVRVYDISEFTQLRPQDLVDSTNVFVTTFASFRVNSTDGRKVYAHNENLEPHFSHISLVDYLERDESGNVKFSFANILAYLRPLVIIDEAHNHISKLSIEVLERLHPSAIIEFTATPDNSSNVLFKVSASELKAEDMIKLPVRLIEHQSWEDAVTNSIQTRERLDELAKQEPAYIRPIVLFQAENVDKEVTVDVLLKYLMEQEEIPREQIAVATGTQRELDDINLFDQTCPVRYVVTIQALKEGWDCSFAYVFCSLAKVQSSKDAEQLLGRVLRMPYAKRRNHDDLNRAYAHVAVASWHEAVSKIRDNLIGMGFEDVEADTSIEYSSPKLFDLPQQEEHETLVFEVKTLPKTEILNLILQGYIDTVEKPTGGYQITIQHAVKKDLQELVEKAGEVFADINDRHKLIQAVIVTKDYSRPLTLSEKGETIEIPQLCLDFGDGPELADTETFLPNSWNILSFPAILDSFQVDQEKHIYEIDIKGTKLSERAVRSQETLKFGSATHWSQVQLVNWLDRKLQQSDIPYESLVEYIRRAVEHLQVQKQVGLPDLVRLRFVLERLLREKIIENRNKAYEAGIQHVLFETDHVAVVGPNVTMSFKTKYPANSFYKGRFQFQNHFFPNIGAMNDEEEDCAKIIDSHKKVKTWVRNIERSQHFSFWLPTSTDHFYPDFVLQLTDGRVAAIEYKGEHLATGSDAKEKNLMGHLWARRSNGRCLFLMATKKDEAGKLLYQQTSDLLS